MIITHQEVRMAKDGEDGTNCDMDVFKKCQDVSFSKVQVWLENL